MLTLAQGNILSRDEEMLIRNALKGGSQPTWNVYWSRVRFASTLTGSGPFTYSIASGTSVQAFNYAAGQSGAAGGFTTATSADTSLLQQAATINSENVFIKGLGIFLAPNSDPILAKQLDPVVATTLILGSKRYKLGNPSFMPGPGGYTGMSESMIAQPSPLDAFVSRIGGMSNGAPIAGNHYLFPRGLLWMPQGVGDSSTMYVDLTSQAAATQPANTQGAADRTAEPQTTTFTGTNAWTHPTAANVFVDYIVMLQHTPFYTA